MLTRAGLAVLALMALAACEQHPPTPERGSLAIPSYGHHNLCARSPEDIRCDPRPMR